MNGHIFILYNREWGMLNTWGMVNQPPQCYVEWRRLDPKCRQMDKNKQKEALLKTKVEQINFNRPAKFKCLYFFSVTSK